MPYVFDSVATFQTNRHPFRLEAGRLYFLDVEGASIVNGSVLENPLMTVRIDGQPVFARDDDGGEGLAARIVFTARETADYIVTVSGFGRATGGYALRVEEDDFRNTVEGVGPAGRVRAGFGSGEIHYSTDHDVHSVSLIGGLTYAIGVRGADGGGGTLADPALSLYGPDGNLIAFDDDSGRGRDPRIVVAPLETGTRFLDVLSSGSTGTYVIAVGNGLGTQRADRIVGTRQADGIDGRGGNDVIRGDDGGDRLFGGAGRDTLLGQDGSDGLDGGSGRDVLRGGDGDDALHGGTDADVLIGGSGKDFFAFGNRDLGRARDVLRAGDGAPAFESAGGRVGDGDRFDLSVIDADRGTGGDQILRLGGTGTGRVSLVDAGRDTLLRVNVDDDRAFELVVVIEDGSTRAGDYNSGDFVL